MQHTHFPVLLASNNNTEGGGGIEKEVCLEEQQTAQLCELAATAPARKSIKGHVHTYYYVMTSCALYNPTSSSWLYGEPVSQPAPLLFARTKSTNLILLIVQKKVLLRRNGSYELVKNNVRVG